ncbi:hypothetical protein TCON_0100 [Astathelohania contejeani]|uniref:Uncharacterized protein n=1 Tax=Astathelohania contejeani TaxID=164912 RepID=A0ABQ7I2N8_9MICR|nr:hypothetical protein TCON_0100 [Thelohania contejeani]
MDEDEKFHQEIRSLSEKYYPYLTPPRININIKREYYTSEICVAGVLIRCDKWFIDPKEAERYILKIGLEFITELIQETVKLDHTIFVNNKNQNIKKGHTKDNGDDNSMNEHNKIELNKSEQIKIEDIKGIETITKRMDNIKYSTIVEEYCREYGLMFPQYTTEKTNGVYVCYADFYGKMFQSDYFYDRMGAKEDTSRLICLSIQRKSFKLEEKEKELYDKALEEKEVKIKEINDIKEKGKHRKVENQDGIEDIKRKKGVDENKVSNDINEILDDIEEDYANVIKQYGGFKRLIEPAKPEKKRSLGFNDLFR